MNIDQIDVLKLGLKFCPTPKSNIPELKEDLREFERKCKLVEKFNNLEDKDDSLVKNKSKFCPSKGSNGELDSVFERLENLNLQEKKNVRDNLSQKQHQALMDLKDNDNIIIKEADKGNAVVIMDTDYYKQKIQEMLSDENSYKLVEKNFDTETMLKIKKLCTKYEKNLTKKETDFLTDFDPKTSNFYGLPKIHKSEEIKNAIETQRSEYIEILNPKDLKFRPIIAGPVCPTHRLSRLADILLQPFLRKVKSYVRDDIDFLNFLPETTDPNTILTTFDVTSLYSNIPHDLGKEAIKFWIEKHPEILHDRFNLDFIIDSLTLILENNFFQFNNENYLQTLGTAMGTKFAPVYATLTLAYLEDILYEKIGSEYGEDMKNDFIQAWKRYLDDCFILWKTDWGDIKDIFSILQNLHPNIKFTMEHDTEKIPFLDILLMKAPDGTLITDIFRKTTDTQKYLHFRSHHPKNCKNSIPLILARRICTIVTDANLKEKRLNELRETLRQRGYPLPLINQGIALAEKIPLKELRSVKEKQDTTPLTFVSTFNRRNPQIFPEINQHLNSLDESSNIKKLLNQGKLIKSQRQPRNLKRILTVAKFGTQEHQGVRKCEKPRCGICPILIEGNSYTFPNTGETFEIKRNLNCQSKNVVYLLECNKCNDTYIGCTSLNLNMRINTHRSQITNERYRFLNVSKHIHECSNDDFRVMPIYQADDDKKLLAKENHFIEKFQPRLNRQ